MIYTLSGQIQAVQKQGIIVGMGPLAIEVAVANPSLFLLHQSYTLFIHFYWNQEMGPALFGFKEQIERDVFLLVIGCSGIGPRIGLAILNDLGVSSFIQAIQKEDELLLSKVNGIGIKKAEQIIVQLKHKIHDIAISGKTADDGVDWATLSDALRALNYSRGEISQAIAFVRNQNTHTQASFDQLLRQTLQFLSKQKQQ